MNILNLLIVYWSDYLVIAALFAIASYLIDSDDYNGVEALVNIAVSITVGLMWPLITLNRLLRTGDT